MPSCEVCGNEYDKTFTIETADSTRHVFDSFECAIHALAPSCARCGSTILGHGVEADGTMYCCASCSHASGVEDIKDRADTPQGEEARRSGASRSELKEQPGRRERRHGAAGAGRTSTVGVSRQSGPEERDDQASLPPRGRARH